MKSGQLIEYKMRNIFSRKIIRKMWWINYSQTIFWINSLKFYTICFYFMPNWEPSKDIEFKLQATCFCLICFLKNKKRSGTSVLVSFSALVFKKIISLVIFYWLTKFHCLVSFTLWDIEYVYCNCLLTRLWRHKFWN